MPFSRESSWRGDQTHVSCISHTAGRFFTTELLGKWQYLEGEAIYIYFIAFREFLHIHTSLHFIILLIIPSNKAVCHRKPGCLWHVVQIFPLGICYVYLSLGHQMLTKQIISQLPAGFLLLRSDWAAISIFPSYLVSIFCALCNCKQYFL